MLYAWNCCIIKYCISHIKFTAYYLLDVYTSDAASEEQFFSPRPARHRQNQLAEIGPRGGSLGRPPGRTDLPELPSRSFVSRIAPRRPASGLDSRYEGS